MQRYVFMFTKSLYPQMYSFDFFFLPLNLWLRYFFIISVFKVVNFFSLNLWLRHFFISQFSKVVKLYLWSGSDNLRNQFKNYFQGYVKAKDVGVNSQSLSNRDLFHTCTVFSCFALWRYVIFWLEDSFNAYLSNSCSTFEQLIDNLFCYKVYAIKCNFCPLIEYWILCSLMDVYLISSYIIVYKA